MYRYESSNTLRIIATVLEVINSENYGWHCDETLRNLDDDSFDFVVTNVAETLIYYSIDTSNTGLVSYLIGSELLRITHEDEDQKAISLVFHGWDKNTGEVMQTHFYKVKHGRSLDHLSTIINNMADHNLHIVIKEV